MADRKRKTYAVTSAGLWRIRADIARLLGAEIVSWPLGRAAGGIDGFVGWGWRPSGLKAKALSARSGKPCLILEDGFIKGYAPGAGEPGHSFVVDDEGTSVHVEGADRLILPVGLVAVQVGERGAMPRVLKDDHIAGSARVDDLTQAAEDAVPRSLRVDQVVHVETEVGQRPAPRTRVGDAPAQRRGGVPIDPHTECPAPAYDGSTERRRRGAARESCGAW